MFVFIWIFALLLASSDGRSCNEVSPTWNIEFDLSNETVSFPPSQDFLLNFTSSDFSLQDVTHGKISVVIASKSPDPFTIRVTEKSFPAKDVFQVGSNLIAGAISLRGNTFGDACINFVLTNPETGGERFSNGVHVNLIREKTILEKYFVFVVVLLTSIMFINFGCALDTESLKQAIKRPIGPALGVVNHFLILPLVAWGFGQLIFDNPYLRLGMFFAAVSPAGGGSNVWTAILGGNLELSIAMTTVSTLLSFAMIPAWVLTVGRTISGNANVGYRKLGEFLFLLVPLCIGYLMQLYCKRVSAIMVKVLKPLSIACILLIIIFATYTHFDLFMHFSWQILFAGMVIPFIGYFNGCMSAKFFGQKPEDILAISVECGVQNTGIAIFLLQVSLSLQDFLYAMVVPVSVSLMTPIPLTIFYLIRRHSRAKNSPTPHRLDLQENSENLKV